MELTPELSTVSILMIGFVLGFQHAVEADHLAAVSTIVSERKSLWTASLVGGLWGVGHTVSLFVVGLLVIFLKLRLSNTVQARLEGVVGIMLVVLGLNVLRKLLRADKVHVHTHEHDGRRHSHIHIHRDGAPEKSHHKLNLRSVVIGMVHGLAGSGLLIFFVLQSISSSITAMLYILVFGIGSIGGMMAMSFVIGLPFHFTAGRFDLLNRGIRLIAGVFSFGLGISIIYERVV